MFLYDYYNVIKHITDVLQIHTAQWQIQREEDWPYAPPPKIALKCDQSVKNLRIYAQISGTTHPKEMANHSSESVKHKRYNSINLVVLTQDN